MSIKKAAPTVEIKAIFGLSAKIHSLNQNNGIAHNISFNPVKLSPIVL